MEIWWGQWDFVIILVKLIDYLSKFPSGPVIFFLLNSQPDLVSSMLMIVVHLTVHVFQLYQAELMFLDCTMASGEFYGDNKDRR